MTPETAEPDTTGGANHRTTREDPTAHHQMVDSDGGRPEWISWAGLGAGLLAALVVYLLIPAEVGHHARLTGAVAVLMGIWWMTEALPIPATALLPLIVFPALADQPFNSIGGSYGNSIIFLFMGGFMLALAMQRWNLHRRIALVTVRAMGTKPAMVIAGFMLATGFLSMWVSNTATAVMMMPIGLSVLGLVATQMTGDEDAEGGDIIRTNFGTALMLGIAYAASIGSLATIIGTPPNTLLAGYMADAHDVTIGFGQWMLVGLPLAVVMLVVCWVLLTKVVFKPEVEEIPGGREMLDREVQKLGRMGSGETRVLIIFVAAALAWVALPLLMDEPPVSDSGIAMIVALLLFLLPGVGLTGERLLDWDTAQELPWGVLLLFGGGLALSSQFSASGLTEWIGESVSGLQVAAVVMVALAAAGTIFLTEITSNTATAAAFLPVAGGVAVGVGMDPLMLAAPVALAATCAFMLPVATPPNAIAYGSGYVRIGDMVKGGLWLNLIGIVLVTLVSMTLLAWVFGVSA
ncbi:SLC13 family permease [Kytococcus sedentarius]|uniref:SLC13 family permease n=1 Tax=Kytococcus sedentarius TaxID=1276 RepID=UPI0038791F9D